MLIKQLPWLYLMYCVHKQYIFYIHIFVDWYVCKSLLQNYNNKYLHVDQKAWFGHFKISFITHQTKLKMLICIYLFFFHACQPIRCFVSNVELCTLVYMFIFKICDSMYLFYTETELFIKVYIGWSHKSHLCGEVQP